MKTLIDIAHRPIELILRWATQIFFSILTLVGLFTYKSYGVSWEAPGLRLNGGTSAIYIADLLHLNVVSPQYRIFPPLSNDPTFDHGVAYDLPLVCLEFVLGIHDTQQIYQFRTLMNFLVFLIGTFCVYLIALRRLKSKKLALLAAAFFVLSPRIFAAGFYSPSDMIFASFLALAVNLCLRYLEKPNFGRALLAGVACGYATDIRLVGCIIFPIMFAYILLEKVKSRPLYGRQIWIDTCYFVSGIFSIYIFYPYLWSNPVVNFVRVFKSLSRYDWNGDDLYFGRLISAHHVPWDYIPVWILITTPILYTVCSAVGFFTILRNTFSKSPWNFIKSQDLIFVALIFGPLVMVITLHSVLYDTWRHLFFIYPYFIILAIIGWNKIVKLRVFRHQVKYVVIAVTAIFMVQTGSWIMRYEPMEYLYFNRLAGSSNLQHKWEMDYLGLGNKAAIEFILSHDNRKKVTVGVASFTPFDMSLKVVKADLRERLVTVPLKDAPDYIVDNFRQAAPTSGYSTKGYHSYKCFIVGNSTYMQIWRKDN
jgi:hypothetical protein